MAIVDMLLGLNSGLLILVLWMAREYWRWHKVQHGQIMNALENLGEIYATKTSLERVHKRLDGIEEGHKSHEARIVQIETRLSISASKRRGQ